MRPAPFRAARGSAVALVGLVLALAAHALGGGPVVPGVATLLPALAVLAGCVVASGRAWTTGRLVLALTTVQAVVHGTAWLMTGAGPVDPRLSGLVAGTSAHQHASVTGLTPPMLAAHGAAVLLAAVALARVDEVVLRLWQVGRTILGLRPVPVTLAVVRMLPAVPAAPAVARARALLASPRRGPPARPAPC